MFASCKDDFYFCLPVDLSQKHDNTNEERPNDLELSSRVFAHQTFPVESFGALE